jgi:MerR family mercuric resistance operon transcriptional regulator/MerR family gold-responsive transcriptional activator of gol and ges genes
METNHVVRIGKAARAAGVSIQTLRYYERLHLLRPVGRESSGYRYYDAGSVRVIRFVKRAQELGFSLREVKELLRFREAPGVHCVEVQKRAKRKIKEIVAAERQHAAMRRALQKLVASCRTERSRRECPLLAALVKDEAVPDT